jgi:hypothetical protein
MNDELTQAINGIDYDRLVKVKKSDNLKKIKSDIILMVMYCLQPIVRSKITVFNFNKSGKLSETILRSICKCKIFIRLIMHITLISFTQLLKLRINMIE